MAINKVVGSFDEGVADVADGAVLHLGGFGGPGECPSYLIAAVARKGVTGLTIVGNLAGWGRGQLDTLRKRAGQSLEIPSDFVDPGILVENDQVAKGILAFPAAPGQVRLPFEDALEAGKVEVELVPQGTLAERIRAARSGIAGFYTPTGPGTITEVGKEKRTFNGREYLLELALMADFALIRAYKGDRYGNLVYKGTGRTFNATMAGAAHVTVAEVDEIVELGELDPDHIHTPGIYVDRVVQRPAERRDPAEPA